MTSGYAQGSNPRQKTIFGRENVNYTGPEPATADDGIETGPPAEDFADDGSGPTLADMEGESFYGYELGMDSGPDLSVDVSDGHIHTEMTDSLDFHVERGSLCPEALDEDGHLTDDAVRVIETRFREALTEAGHPSPESVGVEAGSWDDPSVSFYDSSAYAENDTLDAYVNGDRFGSFTATVINTTDPGTFNSPYLFDVSADDLAAIRDQ